MKRTTSHLLLSPLLLLFWVTAIPALGADHNVGIGDCDVLPACFSPATLTIHTGDAVTFSIYAESYPTGPHNVVADDGSFRCARGCDGEGGDGTPMDYSAQWRFTRTFATPGRVGYHDEVTGVKGEIVVKESATFTIGPGMTGAWFDPAQSGHGLFIEVLPANRFLAAWFTFDPDGAPTWFLGVGTYSGNIATITEVRETTGGRWIPNFDPGQIVNNPWGTLTFTFNECNHGKVEFNSTRGFGSGSMELRRLTQPLGLTCPGSR